MDVRLTRRRAGKGKRGATQLVVCKNTGEGKKRSPDFSLIWQNRMHENKNKKENQKRDYEKGL